MRDRSRGPQARQKSSTRRPVAVDLFCGAGGLSLGAEQAGFDVLAAMEYDPVHAAAHAYNFPKTELVCQDARKVTAKKVREAAAAGWRQHRRRGEWDGSIDAMFGGPPCQGFSVGGLGEQDDERNGLVFEFARLVGDLKPSYFVMENVPGMQGAQGAEGGLLDELRSALESTGYNVAEPWVLNACFAGVPQDRRRLFLIGAREDAELPSKPSPRVRPVPKRNGARPRKGFVGDPSADQALPRGPSVLDAIGDLPDPTEYEELWQADAVDLDAQALRDHDDGTSKYGARLRGIDSDPDDLSHPRKWNRALLTSSMLTRHLQKSIDRMGQAPEGTFEPVSRFYRLDGDGLSSTLRAGSGYDRGSFSAPRPIHPLRPRVITVREAARLHSFPDWFRFHPTKWHGFRQVGNALPPLLGREVAREVVNVLGLRPRRPTAEWELGDSDLLGAEMLTASAHFGADKASIPGHHLRRRSGDANVAPEALAA